MATTPRTILRLHKKWLERREEDLRRQGYAMATEEYGEPRTGKTIRARALETELRASGKQVRILDDIPLTNGGTGVQVWVKG